MLLILSLDNRLDAKGKGTSLELILLPHLSRAGITGVHHPALTMSDIFFKDIAGANESPIYNVCSVIEPRDSQHQMVYHMSFHWQLKCVV